MENLNKMHFYLHKYMFATAQKYLELQFCVQLHVRKPSDV